MWKYDGNNAPSMVADINPGISASGLSGLTVFNNALYFMASDGTNGNELWKYDGTNAPSMIADINPGNDGIYNDDLIVFNNELHFNAYDGGTNGFELWKYDGVNAPSMVADINPEVMAVVLDILPSSIMNFISKPPMELTDLNCGSMMELMLQVWLLISILEVAAVTPLV